MSGAAPSLELPAGSLALPVGSGGAAVPAWPADLFRGERYAVVGLGRNGAPVARALLAMGADVLAWDDHAAARDAAAAQGVPIGDAAAAVAGFDALVLSPGIPHRMPAPHPAAAAALKAGTPIISDAELLYVAAWRAGLGARFAGITGTNGKSTTTALLAHVLAGAGLPVAAGGNLGTPALALPPLCGGVYVLEMSSYMLERLATVRFDVAVMLNLSPDHLDRHGGMAGYADAKRQVFERHAHSASEPAVQTAILGVDDAESRAMAEALPASSGRRRIVRVSGREGPADVWCDAGGCLRDAAGPILPMSAAPALPGAHNAQNAAAVAAASLALGVGRDAIARGIASFAGLPHRQQPAGTVGGVLFVNDSKATNADAAARALACYPSLVWIAGGEAKAGGIEALRPLLRERVRHALLIGRDAPVLAGTLAEIGVPYTQCGALDAAVPAALHAARETGAPVVLLSPACASWDQFTGFEARGDRFAALVRGLAEQGVDAAGGDGVIGRAA